MSKQTGKVKGSTINIILAALIGLVVGIFIGTRIGSGTEEATKRPAPSALSLSTESASAAAAPPTLPERVDLDPGSRSAKGALGPGWRQARVDRRTVAVAEGKSAEVTAALQGKGKDLVMTAVARAVDVADGTTVGLTVAINGRRAASWSVGSEWGLYWTQVPKGAVDDGLVTVAFEPDVSSGGETTADALAFALDHLFVGETADTAAVDLTTEYGRATLLSGFYGVEGMDKKQPAVWSKGKRSKMGLVLHPATGPYAMRVLAYGLTAIVPIEVDVSINGKPAGSFELSGRETYVVSLPAGLLQNGVNNIEFAYAKSGRPADLGVKSRDERDLAMRLFRLDVHPAE